MPCLEGEEAMSVSSVAKLFFDNLVRFLGILGKVILNREPRFTVSFW